MHFKAIELLSEWQRCTHVWPDKKDCGKKLSHMRVEPIGLAPPNPYIPEISSRSKRLGAVDITPLLPETQKPATLWDIIAPDQSPFADLFSVLDNIVETKLVLVSYRDTISLNTDSGADYERYLQFPNAKIQALTDTIVRPGEPDDMKMYKIEQWVIDNITYVSDLEQYGENELWALPTMTLDSSQGDCEDGAFLIHTLALHAGVESERLRTYGGLVATGEGTGVGGHAWTAYRREIDDHWIILDWSYWPTDAPLAERDPMSEQMKYIDDYFFVQATKTVETPYTNRVRYAGGPPAFFLNIRA